MKDRPTPTRVHAPRTKDGEDDAVTFRRPRTRMDEPGHHFFGVKRPSGRRETGAPSRSSHKSQFPSSSMRHRRRLGTTPTRLSHRLGLSDEGRATAFPTRSGALVANVHLGADRAAVTLSRTATAAESRGDVRPSGPEAPRDNLIVVHRLPRRVWTWASHEYHHGAPATSLDWGQPRGVTTALAPRPRRTSSCTESVGLDPFCRHYVEFPRCQ